MKNLILLTLIILVCGLNNVRCQVGINTTGNAPDASAVLDVSADNKGMLMPRLTTAERDAIADPAHGLMIFNTTSNCINIFQSGFWFELCATCIKPASPVANSNSPVCQGQSLNLTTSGVSGATYSWSGPNGFSSNLQNPSLSGATPSMSGAYTLIITVNNCQSDPVSVNATVNPNPTADAGSDVSIVNGSSTTLIASGGTSYLWSNGTATASNTVSPGSTTSYTVTATDVNGCTDTDDVLVTVLNLQVGDTHGGGIIFQTNGSNGLISATSDQSTSIEWGCFGADMSAFSNTDGQPNTTSIVNGCGSSSIAARLCDNLSLNGYSDWYLPAKNELNTLYGQKNTVGGFSSGNYWSSTEFNINLAWYQNFGTGVQENYNNIRKYDPQRVRCIRKY